MATNPTDHELNALLARVCGITLNNMGMWWQLQYSTHGMEWNPLHDANQMERVEVLVQLHHKITYDWDGESWHVKLDYGWHYKHDPNKKRAFALAVYAMEQGKLTT